jgi:hypothetical protein
MGFPVVWAEAGGGAKAAAMNTLATAATIENLLRDFIASPSLFEIAEVFSASAPALPAASR